MHTQAPVPATTMPWGHHMLLIDKVKDDYKKDMLSYTDIG